MASVEAALIRPAATFVIVRSLPAEPTLTVLVGEVPAKLYEVPLMVILVVVSTCAAVEPLPSATSPSWKISASWPITTTLLFVTSLFSVEEPMMTDLLAPVSL